MFEISQLKAKTLIELQEIAKTIGAKKYSQLKKLDLVYLILDIQASSPTKQATSQGASTEGKARRKRIPKKGSAEKQNRSVEKREPSKKPESEKNQKTPAPEVKEKQVKQAADSTPKQD